MDGSLGAPILMKLLRAGECRRIRSLPVLSSAWIWFPLDVVIIDLLWFDDVTGLGASGLGTAVCIIGLSGSPSMKVRSTSVSLWRGKCMPWLLPA